MRLMYYTGILACAYALYSVLRAFGMAHQGLFWESVGSIVGSVITFLIGNCLINRSNNRHEVNT